MSIKILFLDRKFVLDMRATVTFLSTLLTSLLRLKLLMIGGGAASDAVDHLTV